MKLRRNKGLLLAIIFLVYIIGILLYNYISMFMFAKQAEGLVSQYIEQNISGQYLTDVTNVYNDIHRIESWTGNVHVRWEDRDEKVLCVKSHLSVTKDAKEEIDVNDIFVLKKEQGVWKISWHGISL